MLAGIDHVVILVADLAEAEDRYTRLGFGVVPPAGDTPREARGSLDPGLTAGVRLVVA